jgi:Bacteriophage Mu Gam like protein
LRVKAPKTLPAATKLLERFAAIGGELALIEAGRAEALARANAEADRAATPLLTERGDLAAALEEWWAAAGDALTGGERKSIELGGCMIGTRADKPALALKGAAKDAISALLKLSWGKALVKISTSLDRRAIARMLDGPRKAELEELGFSIRHGDVGFVLERVSQEGVRA